MPDVHELGDLLRGASFELLEWVPSASPCPHSTHPCCSLSDNLFDDRAVEALLPAFKSAGKVESSLDVSSALDSSMSTL